jgi:hypothetical protein
MSRPDADFQIQFLEYIQRLLDGGVFTATYKYALLMALADLSVEKGRDDDSPLPLEACDVAQKFIIYYSRQARPYNSQGNDDEGILHQNTDRQAAVINRVREAIPQYAAQGYDQLARQLQMDRHLLSSVTKTVAEMPLWKLQTIGNQQEEDFLYPNLGSGRSFELRPGIAFCFRKFHGFIYRLAQDGWIRFVRQRPQNQYLLGEVSDLGDFMFGRNRATLTPYKSFLQDLQNGRCFYCQSNASSGDVDHFIPWSWYNLDLGHNFVLACASCNRQKRDHLASPGHLENWLMRNEGHAVELVSFFDRSKLPYDLNRSMLIAHWAYERVASTGGQTWAHGRQFQRIAAEDGWSFPKTFS